MSSNDENQSALQLPTPNSTLTNHNQVAQYFNLCLEASTRDDLCSRLAKVPLSLRIHVYEALHVHFQSNLNNPFFDVSLFGIFFSTFKESSTVISGHVDTILEQPDSNTFKEQFCLIPLNLRAEVHEAFFQKALWSHDQTDLINSLNISTDLYDKDIQLTEADQEASRFQNSLFDALDEFSFITQFRQIPLQYRSSVHKALLHTVQQDEQSAEFCGWVSTIRAADLYLDFDDIAQRISEEAHIYANACFIISTEPHFAKILLFELPFAIGGQVCRAICFKALMLPHPCKNVALRLSYLRKHKSGPLHELNKILNAPNHDAFITEFMAIDRSRRIQIHNDLYFYTKSDLVKYKDQFDWVLQCTHPYYFLDGFDDDLESESNQAVKCAHDFIANPGHRDAIFAQFAQFSEHSSRFKFCLTLESKSSYKWMSSHLDLQQYVDPLYPELISATEKVKECVGRCLLAPNLGEFKVAFHSIPFSMRHEVYTSLSFYQHCYHTKQQSFLNALQPLEVTVDVHHYISDDQLVIYATACSSMQNPNEFKRFLSSVPYSIRFQVYKLTLLLYPKPCYLNTSYTLYSSYLWEIPTLISSIPQVVECLDADNFGQFKSTFLSIPRESRLEAYDALYVGTQNDQSKFIWLLQCTHPYYFFDGFDDDDFKSEFDAKFSETFLVYFDRDDVYDTFTRLPQSSRFDLLLKLASPVFHTWLISHTDKLPRYLSCLYPELVSATEEVKEWVGRCLLAPNLGEFKVVFHSIPFSMRHEVYTSLSFYQHCYHTKQQSFLNALQPLEVTVDVNHYIPDDQLAIYATECPTSFHDRNGIAAFFHIVPYSIRAQVYHLLKLKFEFQQALLRLDLRQPVLSSSLWAIKNVNTSHNSQINNPNISHSPDSDLVFSFLNANNFDQFKSTFLSIPRQLRSKAYEALYVGTQNDRSKFIWLLQCTHPYYFLYGFDDSNVDDGDTNGEQQLQ